MAGMYSSLFYFLLVATPDTFGVLGAVPKKPEGDEVVGGKLDSEVC